MKHKHTSIDGAIKEDFHSTVCTKIYPGDLSQTVADEGEAGV